MADFSQPCTPCRAGEHNRCQNGVCGCIAFHRDDDPIMRGFKKLKQAATGTEAARGGR